MENSSNYKNIVSFLVNFVHNELEYVFTVQAMYRPTADLDVIPYTHTTQLRLCQLSPLLIFLMSLMNDLTFLDIWLITN